MKTNGAWDPAPREYTLELLKVRWDKDHPAPTIVAHHWVWHILDRGGSVSRRDLADYAGWSQWRARKLLEEMASNRLAWENKQRMSTGGETPATPQTAQPPPSNRPADSTIPDSCEATPPSNRPAAARLRARDPSCNRDNEQLNTSECSKEHLSDKPDPAADTWARMLEIRARHRPKARTLKLTGYRRRVLNGRLKDHDAEALLRATEWHYISNHTTATWNREQGHDLDTLIRPANFDRYLEIAHSEADHSQHPKPQVNGRDQYRSLAERMGAEDAAPNPTPQAEVVVVDFTPKAGADHG